MKKLAKLEADAEYRRVHRVEVRATHRAWVERNPERNRQHKKNHNAKPEKRQIKLVRQRLLNAVVYQNNRVELIKRAREYQSKNPEKIKVAARKQSLSRYGITPEVWEKTFEGQGRRCAICRVEPKQNGRRFHTDHCHETGKIRGILCNYCNLMLGHAKDSVARLNAAIAYLEGKRL